MREYVDETGRNHFREWFDDLAVEYAAKVTAARSRMMAGNLSNLKTVDGSLKEFKIDWGPGIRIYLVQERNTLIVLLCGGVKSGQNADIQKAKRLRDEYARRKAEFKQQQKRTP
ncbi:type II toxin-antitoxin system RelE/ParE family toxin [Desulfonatronum parangueonense]